MILFRSLRFNVFGGLGVIIYCVDEMCVVCDIPCTLGLGLWLSCIWSPSAESPMSR